MESKESRLNSSGTSSKDSQRCSSTVKSQIYLAIWDKHHKLSQEEFSSCQCSMTSPVTEKATKKNVWQMPESSPFLQRDLVLDNGHLLVQVLKRSGLLQREAHKSLGSYRRRDAIGIRRKRTSCFPRNNSIVQGSLKSKGHEKLSIHLVEDQNRIEPLSHANQVRLYGAVANMCEFHQGETSRSHEIDEKGFHGELCSSDRSGKLDNLHGSGQLVQRNSSSAHTVKEQVAYEENRDITLFNTDNEFNRAINEEDIDFNIPGLSHSTVKQLHSASVRDLI